MPYPNEHAARLTDPSKYESFRRFHPRGFPDGIDAILGIKSDGSTEMQAIRAKRAKFTLSQFKRFLTENDMKPIKVEEATGVEKAIELFSTWTEIDMVKSREENSDEPKVYIAGVVSSDAEDLQGDRILQDGMEWSYFLRRGWLNYEHKQGPENILGVPTSVQQVEMENGKRGTRVEGYLLTSRPKAREIAETAKALKSMNSERSIGYSIEGQVLQRDAKNPKIITKARILNVSITAHPVNPDTSLELVARSLLDVGDFCEQTQEDSNLTERADMEMTEKGTVGYQQPGKPSESDSMSPLVAQSPEMTMSSEMDDEDEMGEERQEAEQLTSLVEGAVKRVMQDAMAELMREEMGKMFDSLKGESKGPAMVSLAQMNSLMAKVFPTLPQGEQKAIARKLLSTAKGYYNKP